MSPTLDQPPLRRAYRYGLIVAVFLCVWTTRAWTIGQFGSDLPYWDQWAKEGEMFFQPWFERHEFWHNLFVPHNEHRIAPSLALNFLLMRAGGDQWDARVQCVANAALWAAVAAALAAWALRRLPRRWALACCGAIATIAAPPIAWENVLGGFQSCFYFVTIASLLAIAGLLLAPPLSARWFGGILAAAVAIVSLGSGLLVAAPIAVVAALRWWVQWRVKKWHPSPTGASPGGSRRDVGLGGVWLTLIAALAIGGVGWWVRPQAPWHAALQTHSILQSLAYAARCLAWPLYGSPWLAVLFWAPWVVFAVRYIAAVGLRLPPAPDSGRKTQPPRPVEMRPHAADASPHAVSACSAPSIEFAADFVLALGLWVLAQVAAVSYARAGGSAAPAPRYGDIFALGLVANAFALPLLARRGREDDSITEPASEENAATVVPTAMDKHETAAVAAVATMPAADSPAVAAAGGRGPRSPGAATQATEFSQGRTIAPAGSIARAYAGAWFALVVIALAFSTVLQVRGDLRQRRTDTDAYEKNVQAFVLTDDYARFDAQQPRLPFPFTDWLARMIRNPSLRRILPSSVHAPISIEGLDTNAKQNATDAASAPAPNTPDGLPPLTNRATRLVRAGDAWQSEAIGPATGYWKIETAGDIGRRGVALEIVSAETGRVLGRVAPSKYPGNTWRAAYVRAPRERAYLRARVEAPAQWIAFSEPVTMSTLSFWTWRFTQQAQWLALAAGLALVALIGRASASGRDRSPSGPEFQRTPDAGPPGGRPLRQSDAAHVGRDLPIPPVAAPAKAAGSGDPALHGDRVFGLDAMRTAAILCVVLAHGGLQFVLGDLLQKLPLAGKYAGWSSLVGHGGAVGVEIFFVLSGFLIGGILLRSGEALATREGLVGFYVRRWFRTLPLFALALAMNVLFEQYVRHHALTAGEIAGHGFFLRNFSHISLTFFPESWSLAVEEWFYLLFPAALFIGLSLTGAGFSPASLGARPPSDASITISDRGRPRSQGVQDGRKPALLRSGAGARFSRVFLCAAGAFLLFSTAMRVWGALQPGATWAGTARCTVIYRFDALMTGVVAAWAALNHPAAWRAHARKLKWAGLLVFFGGYAFWWTYHVTGPVEAPDTFFARTFRFTVMPLGLALLLPALSQWAPSREGWPHRAVRRIALWSYALYLVHWPFYQIVGGDWSKSWQAAAGAWYFVAKVLAAIAIAAVLHVAFEAPAMRLRNRLRAGRLAARAEPAGASADVR